MAKRFTDTDKWKRPWFTELPDRAKLVWIYIVDNCDHAGFWPADFKLLSFQTGKKTTKEQFESWFGDKVVAVNDKYFIPSFVNFQYGILTPSNNTHRSVISTVKKAGVYELLASPSRGDQDKDKDTDKDKDKDKEKDSDKPKPIPSTKIDDDVIHVLPPRQPPVGIPDEIKKEWETTLAHYGRGPDWIRDEAPMCRLFQKIRSWPRIKNALAGFREEKAGKGYDPSTQVYLGRLDVPKSFDFLQALGETKAVHRPKDDANAKEKAELREYVARVEAEMKAAL